MMRNPSNIENLILPIAETYKTAVIDNINMRLATESLEVIHNICLIESDSFKILKVIDKQLGLITDDRLINLIIKLRSDFQEKLLEKEVVQLIPKI